MADEFVDARLEELAFLSDLDRTSEDLVAQKIESPGQFRDMIAFLIYEGYINDLNPKFTLGERVSWFHDNRGVQEESNLERNLYAERIEALNSVLRGQPTHVRINHRGRVRLSELKQDLQKDRIRESFGILWDKRHLETDLRIALLEASNAHPLSVALMDMNGLKQINDSNGHEAGDAALKTYFHEAESLLGVCGTMYRGDSADEVVAILKDCNQEQASKLLREMCQSLKSERVQIEDVDLPPLTVSVGFVTIANPATAVKDILKQADTAMYEGKHEGKAKEPRPSSIVVYGDRKVEMV